MNMDGKTVLITGSTDGVGRYVAAKLAAAGAKVLIHGRDAARAKSLVDEIKRGRARGADLLSGRSVVAGGRATARRSGDRRAQAARRLRQQCRDRIADVRAGAADQR